MSLHANNSSSLSVLEKGIGIVIALVTGWSAYQSSNIKDQVALQATAISEMNAENERRAEERALQKQNYEITLKIFEEVQDIYKTSNQTPLQTINRLSAVLALVQAIPDQTVKQTLAEAIKAAVENVSSTQRNPSDEFKFKAEALVNQAEITGFQAENDISTVVKNHVNINTSRYSNYDIDIFWCESSNNENEAKLTAESILGIKSRDSSASGRWRARKLPSAVNRRPGYQMSGYVIRISSNDELPIANNLVTDLNQMGIPSAGDIFKITRSSMATPWYLSIFLCPDVNNGGK